MARLLYEAASRGIASEYCTRLLSFFPETIPTEIPQPAVTDAGRKMIEPLSRRERDVLQLMAEGLTNQEIGERLFISAHTVKVHSRSIYAKLDSHNRTEAVGRARAYGLLV